MAQEIDILHLTRDSVLSKDSLEFGLLRRARHYQVERRPWQPAPIFPDLLHNRQYPRELFADRAGRLWEQPLGESLRHLTCGSYAENLLQRINGDLSAYIQRQDQTIVD